MAADRISRAPWVREHAHGSVALVAGIRGPELAFVLAGEGIDVVFAGDADTVAAATRAVEDEPAAIRQRVQTVESDADLSGFAARQFDLAVIGSGLFAERDQAAAAAARVLDAGATLVGLPPGGNEALRPATVVAVLDAVHADFAVTRLDLVEHGIGLVARRRATEEPATRDPASTHGAVVLDLAARLADQLALTDGLRTGLATRDQAFAALEAELNAAQPQTTGDWADADATPDAAPAAPLAADPPPPAPAVPPAADAVLDQLDGALTVFEERAGRRRLEASLAELEAVLALDSPDPDGDR